MGWEVEIMNGSLWSRAVRRFMAVWGVFAFGVLPLAGCADKASNSDSAAPLAVTKSGIQILEVERSEALRTVEATIAVAGEERRVAITKLFDGPLASGITARLTNEAGPDAFEFSIAADPATGEMWYRAQAGTDVLTASVHRTGARVYESYEINGDRFDVDYPALPPEQMQKAFARYRSGTLGQAVDADLQEINGKLSAFESFASAHEVPAFSGSGDGAVLASLLGDPAFAGLVSGDPIDPQRVDGLDYRTCLALSWCVTFSCAIPQFWWLCVPCSGGLIGCIIMEVICWFIGCDCCF
jgi:hypothetical protein